MLLSWNLSNFVANESQLSHKGYQLCLFKCLIRSQLVRNKLDQLSYLGFILNQFKCEQGFGTFLLMGYNPGLGGLKSFLVIQKFKTHTVCCCRFFFFVLCKFFLHNFVGFFSFKKKSFDSFLLQVSHIGLDMMYHSTYFYVVLDICGDNDVCRH